MASSSASFLASIRVTFANSTPNEPSGYAETSALVAAQQYYFKAIISILIARIITRAAPSAITSHRHHWSLDLPYKSFRQSEFVPRANRAPQNEGSSTFTERRCVGGGLQDSIPSLKPDQQFISGAMMSPISLVACQM
jgi:hypothetical protein